MRKPELSWVSTFQLGTISVLRDITQDYETRKLVTDLGGVPLLVKLLNDSARPLQILVAETLANVAKMRKAQKIVRKTDGLPQLVSFRIRYLDTSYVFSWRICWEVMRSIERPRSSIKVLWKLRSCIGTNNVKLRRHYFNWGGWEVTKTKL